jgi:hypothetical protein
VLSSGGKKFGNDAIWKQILKDADEDGDGFITFPEFTNMMNKFVRASEMVDRFTLQSQLSKSSNKKNKEGESSTAAHTPHSLEEVKEEDLDETQTVSESSKEAARSLE